MPGNTSEYRIKYLPVYFGRKSKLFHPQTPFSGLTCSLPAYKPTRIHPVPPLTAKDPVYQGLINLAVQGTPIRLSDPKSMLHRLYLRSEYRDNFASLSARARQHTATHELIQRCQTAPSAQSRR